MITLRRPDPTVAALLMKHEMPKDSSIIRPSLYAIPFCLDGRRILCHTLTGQVVETTEYYVFEIGEHIAFDEANGEINELYKAGFLVPEATDDFSNYDAVFTLLRQMKETPEGCLKYTIYPTTACNARCFYCFEKGIHYETMTSEVTEKVIDFIRTTRQKGRLINIVWYGGEPLLGESVIDRICEGLRSDGIHFFSTMISNGSLFTEELVKKAAGDWRLDQVQITLDGREEMYNRRKNYRSFSGSPYRAVLNAIHLLLSHRIHVTIGLNMDEDNYSDLLELLDDLVEEFRDSENKPSVFVRPLRNGEIGKTRFGKELSCKLENIAERVRDIQHMWKGHTSESKGVETPDHVQIYSTPTEFCPKYKPTSETVILVNGDLTYCRSVKDAPITGTVFDGTLPEAEPYDKLTDMVNAECRSCPLAPCCSKMQGCLLPGRGIGGDCREHCAFELRKTLYRLILNAL